MPALNATHDPQRTSWVPSANDGNTDFPIQNLPHGIFRRQGSSENWRGGVAIGDQIVDMAAAVAAVRRPSLARWLKDLLLSVVRVLTRLLPPAVVVLSMQRWFVKGLVETEK